MSTHVHQRLTSRRTPPLGVSGVTLLMLVTLVLTTSPALGRAKDVGPVDQSRSLAIQERTVPSQRVEQRQGGPRKLANRQIRPSGSGFVLSFARALRSPLAAIVSQHPELTGSTDSPSGRVGLMLLNLPPPRD